MARTEKILGRESEEPHSDFISLVFRIGRRKGIGLFFFLITIAYGLISKVYSLIPPRTLTSWLGSVYSEL